MSYYQHQGAVQGGGYGALDDEMRKRRRHFRDAGAPYSGGASQPPSQQPALTTGKPAPKPDSKPAPKPAMRKPTSARMSKVLMKITLTMTIVRNLCF